MTGCRSGMNVSTVKSIPIGLAPLMSKYRTFLIIPLPEAIDWIERRSPEPEIRQAFMANKRRIFVLC